MTLLDMLRAFVSFREEVISRRTKYLLKKARERAHVLVGLAIAVANIDEVIRLIRQAPDPQTAREQLMERRWPAADVEALILLIDDPRHRINEDGTYNLSEEQARAILELRLQRLTALGRDEIADELNTIGAEISDYLEILSSRARIQQIVKDELISVRDEFGTPRRTELTDGGADMDDEDLIQREDMVVTVTHEGYIKRVPLSIYRAQARGGKGRSGMSTKDEDFVTRLFVANTHTPILFFSSRGIVYKEKVWRLPIGTPQSRGKFLRNMLPLEEGDRITAILPLPDEEEWGKLDVMFATTRGTVRRNKLSDFADVKRNGKIAMKFDEAGRCDPRRRDLHGQRRRTAHGLERPVHTIPRVGRPCLRGALLAGRQGYFDGGGRPRYLHDHSRACRRFGRRAFRLSQARRGGTPCGADWRKRRWGG
jgi:DNA gyrase subunit A